MVMYNAPTFATEVCNNNALESTLADWLRASYYLCIYKYTHTAAVSSYICSEYRQKAIFVTIIIRCYNVHVDLLKVQVCGLLLAYLMPVNSLPTNDGKCSNELHKPIRIYMGKLILSDNLYQNRDFVSLSCFLCFCVG